MVLTQQSVLSLLIAEGGKVKKADIVEKFKDSLECDDPEERQRNRHLFKTIVNKIAFVKEIDGVRYVVVKKQYQNSLEGVQTEGSPVGMTGNEDTPTAGEQQRPPARTEGAESSEDTGKGSPSVSEADQEQASESCENPTEILSAIQLALQRSKSTDIKVKRTLNFEIQHQDTNTDTWSRKGAMRFNSPSTSHQSKPYALPLRMPPTTRVEIQKLKGDPDEPPESPKVDAFRNKRGPPSVETVSTVSSPQLRRSVKSTKASEEPNETRVPSMVPLEQSEHEWLVKCAAGHWSQVYGLLLRDNQLADKRDFMSGFTALHWAAKCGKSEMLVKIMDVAKKGGIDIDINAKTYGGYTPLHIAALHDQVYILTMLVGEYGADISIRDNCGKKAYHYLHNGVCGSVREMLGEPKVQQAQDTALPEKDELELFPDLTKGLHTISRLFQPHLTAHKKKNRQRPGLFSHSDDPSEERDDSSNTFRNRLLSDVFMS